MKTKISIFIFTILIAIANLNAHATTNQTDEDLLGLPGDNLDLYAVLNLFQESKTIEDFEKSLNDEKTEINNLDLNIDGKVDFIKVETKQDGTDFVFVLQVDVLKGEIQDVAVILVSKDKDENVTLQIVGNESLYGKDYVIEPKLKEPVATANPGYSGPDTVVIETKTVVVVESAPIVHYVYSPVYVPYYPPYYYGYYPVYYRPYPVISVNIYFGRNRHHHNHYHGGHNKRGGNTVIINNNNNYNRYNKTRNTSNTVNRNKSKGNYKRNDASSRPSRDSRVNNDRKKPESRNTNGNIKDKRKSTPSNKPNTRPASKPTNRSSASPKTKPASTPKAKPARSTPSRSATARGGKRR